MLVETNAPASAHLIVVGNEKGGSGKSTTAIHLAVGLLKAGHRVATIDADWRQRSLSHFVENRRRRSREGGLALELPLHVDIPAPVGETPEAAEAIQYSTFTDAVSSAEYPFDFIVVDTAGADSRLMRLCHSMADTLVTPINDSFVDLDALGDSSAPGGVRVGHYGALVAEARARRRDVDGGRIDWVVLRNRVALLASRNNRSVGDSLARLAAALDFRLAGGVSERAIFRELFPMGLTPLDALDRKTLGRDPSMSHLTARSEIRDILEALGLPRGERAQRRAEAQRIWREAAATPIETLDLLAD